MKPQTLYLVDASIYVFRALYSIPESFHDPKGNLVNGVYGYAGFLVDVLSHKPEQVSVAFDQSLNTCFRNEIYPLYKANRDQPDENIKYQFDLCREITDILGMHHLSLKSYEADDIIGTLAITYGADCPVSIVTRDKDLGQLLKPGDTLWDFAANVHSGPAEVHEKFGVTVSQLADYLALAGDAVDNIPGATGIGAKTAAKLLNHFDTLENLLGNTDRVLEIGIRGADRIRRTLDEQADQLRLFRRITQIDCQVPMPMQLAQLALKKPDIQRIKTFSEKLGFGDRMTQRLCGVAGA